MKSNDLIAMVERLGSEFIIETLRQALEREPVACLNELALIQNIIHTKMMEEKNDPSKGI